MHFDPAQLAAPFPADAVHWRAQSLKADGTSAMALAFIDARDVMDRLDAVCGPGNWQDSYSETPKGRLICTLTLRIGDEWISKSDGAGDTDVEGDKGAISDALKRAAVKWGIGRYLYSLPVVWADCESYDRNGKKHWKKWTPAGLQKLARAGAVAGVPAAIAAAAPLIGDPEKPASVSVMEGQIAECKTLLDLQKWKRDHGNAANATGWGDHLVRIWNERKATLEKVAA